MWLTVRSGGAAGRTVELRDGQVVGRDASSDVQLEDPKISRRHAVFHIGADGAVVLQDLGSTNGTFVNGSQIGSPVRLRGDEHVRFGDTVVSLSNTRPSGGSDPRVGATVGRYLIKELIAEGSMGVVYGAEHTRTGRAVALKFLNPRLFGSPRSRERFLQESRSAGGLEHPNIVPIYDADEVDGVPYIAMRRVRGHDLNTILARNGPLPPDEAVSVIEQVGSALDAAHRAGLVHRVVKPGNILITGDDDPEGGGKAFLTDFGITKDLGADRGMTVPGHAVGTRDYMAPEQFSGGAVDARTDVYALGCVLFEAATGVRPFSADSEIALMQAHLQAPPPSAHRVRPELSPALDGVIARALAKQSNERFASCGELANAARRALESSADPSPVTSAQPDLPTRPDLASTVAEAGPSGATLIEAGGGTMAADVRPDPAGATVIDAAVDPDRTIPDTAASTGTATVADIPSPPAPSPGRGRMAIIAAGVLAVALMAAGAFLLLRPAQEPPPPPRGVHAEPTVCYPPECDSIDGTITVSWSPADDTPVSAYTVMRDDVALADVDGTETRFQDDEVLPGESYTYWVVATGEHGSSAPSVKIDPRVPLPLLTAARLTGRYTVLFRIDRTRALGSWDGFNDVTAGDQREEVWVFDAECPSPEACDVTLERTHENAAGTSRSLDPVELSFDGSTYESTFEGEAGCSVGPDVDYVVEWTLRVTRAEITGNTWRADRFEGEATLSFDCASSTPSLAEASFSSTN